MSNTQFDIHDNYLVIQGWMIQNLGLKGTELMLYALIYGFSQDEESVFSGTIAYMRSWLQCSDSTIITNLQSLVSKNLVYKNTVNKPGLGVRCYYKVNPELVKIARGNQFLEGGHQFLEGGNQLLVEGQPIFRGGPPIFGANNIIDNINNKIEDNIIDKGSATHSNPFEITQSNKREEQISPSKKNKRKATVAPGANWSCAGMSSTNTSKLSSLSSLDNQLAREKKKENELKEANELSPLEKRILARQKQLTKISREYFTNEDIITILNRYIYNRMEITNGAKIGTESWVEQLTELKTLCKNDQQIIDAVKLAIRGNYKKLFVPDSLGKTKNGCQWDNTRGVDRPKELSEMSETEREEFTNTLATDEDGNLLSF